MRAGADGQGGRGTAWRPRTTEDGHHQEAGFIEANQVGAAAPEFFYPGQSWRIQSRTRRSSRSLARGWGR